MNERKKEQMKCSEAGLSINQEVEQADRAADRERKKVSNRVAKWQRRTERERES